MGLSPTDKAPPLHGARQCQSFGTLGVSYVEFDFGIHASGSANGSRATKFDRAISTLDYTWSLTSSLGDIALGGHAGARREGTIDEFPPPGGVSGGTAHLRMRPGDSVELKMQAIGGSEAAFAEVPASALVDFANTLRWDGVKAFTAFDSTGQVVSLAAGNIVLQAQDSGFDYWQAASSPLTTVPIPFSAWLFSSALAAMGIIGRRRAA